MTSARIVDVVNFMPERVVVNETLAAASGKALMENAFFRGVRERRFASPEYLSEDLGTRVVQKLLERTGTAASQVDLILCSCIFMDTFWPGIGPAIQHRIGASNATMMNVDTSCSSFLSMLNVGRAFIESGRYKTVVVVTVTNFISRLPEFQQSRRSWVLGDGASATLMVAGPSSIVSSFERSHGEHYGLFRFEPDLIDGYFKNFWERGCGPITVTITEEKAEQVRENAMKLVPSAVKHCLDEARMQPSDVSLLITHQPNQMFLDEWRSKIGVPPARCHDTLAIYGNLFQGSIPVTLADAIDQGKVKPGDRLALGTFSMGGDFVSAMVIHWG